MNIIKIMKYRYFASPIEEVKKQFINKYNKNDVLYADNQDEFLEIVMNPNYHTAVIFDSFLFFDILTENNIYHLKKLENYFQYIVFCGDNLEELHKRLKII